MAKQRGFQKFSGGFGDLIMYYLNGQWVVRRKGFISRKRRLRSKEFAKSRANSKDFTAAVHAGKNLRHTFKEIMGNTASKDVTSRMNKTMSKVLKFDTVHQTGKRKISYALKSEQAKRLIKNFQFNDKAPLSRVLFRSLNPDMENGKIIFKNFCPEIDVKYPASATHVQLYGGYGAVDFTNEKGKMEKMNAVTLPINEKETNVTLQPVKQLKANGMKMLVVGVKFFKKENANMIEIMHGNYCALGVVGVG